VRVLVGLVKEDRAIAPLHKSNNSLVEFLLSMHG
jgi:hypothetical protein